MAQADGSSITLCVSSFSTRYPLQLARVLIRLYLHRDSAEDTDLYSIIHASTSLIDPILCHDTCDVDIRNRHDGDTPLHIAVRQRWEEHTGLRLFLGLLPTLLLDNADTLSREPSRSRR